MSISSFHAAIARDRLLGPWFIASLLTGGCLQNIPTKGPSRAAGTCGSAAGIHLWLMNDGAPPHFLPAFRKFLNSMFPKQRIGRS